MRVALGLVVRAWGGSRALLRVLLAGLLVLPVASRPLAIWAGTLPDWASPIRSALVWWDGEMDAAHLTAPYDTLHRWMRDGVERSF